VIEKMTAIQMIDVHLPTTDGRMLDDVRKSAIFSIARANAAEQRTLSNLVLLPSPAYP
jgi:hypothetical protein